MWLMGNVAEFPSPALLLEQKEKADKNVLFFLKGQGIKCLQLVLSLRPVMPFRCHKEWGFPIFCKVSFIYQAYQLKHL